MLLLRVKWEWSRQNVLKVNKCKTNRSCPLKLDLNIINECTPMTWKKNLAYWFWTKSCSLD